MRIVLALILLGVFFAVFMAGASLGVERGAPVVHSLLYGE